MMPRVADASADAHLCSVPSRGAIKAVPDRHLGRASSYHIVSTTCGFVPEEKNSLFQDYILENKETLPLVQHCTWLSKIRVNVH